MNKRYLENLSEMELMEVVENCLQFKEMLEDGFVETELDFINDIINVLGGKHWDIGFYQRNYWEAERSIEQLESIEYATDMYGLLGDDSMEKVKKCMELVERLNMMDYDNKQRDNLENKIEKLFNEIDNLVTESFNLMTDSDNISMDVLFDRLILLLDSEDNTYYVLDDDLETVYKDVVKAYH